MHHCRSQVGGISGVCFLQRKVACGRTARGISWTASSCVWRSPRDRSERRVRSCYRRFRASRKKICRNAYANSLTLAPRALFGCESAEGTTLLDVLAAVVRAYDLDTRNSRPVDCRVQLESEHEFLRIRSRIFQQVRVTDFARFGGPDLAYNARELRLCAYWASQAKEAYCHLKTAPSCFAGSVRGHRTDLSYPPRFGCSLARLVFAAFFFFLRPRRPHWKPANFWTMMSVHFCHDRQPQF